VEADLERIVVGKARQLDERIRHFREAHYAFGATTAADVKTIMPVVVTGEPIPMWTTITRTTRSMTLVDSGRTFSKSSSDSTT
jgi:hypothetical protein